MSNKHYTTTTNNIKNNMSRSDCPSNPESRPLDAREASKSSKIWSGDLQKILAVDVKVTLQSEGAWKSWKLMRGVTGGNIALQQKHEDEEAPWFGDALLHQDLTSSTVCHRRLEEHVRTCVKKWKLKQDRSLPHNSANPKHTFKSTKNWLESAGKPESSTRSHPTEMLQGDFKEAKETTQTSDFGSRSASNWPQTGDTDRKHLKEMVWGRFVAPLHLFPYEPSCKTQQLMSVYLSVKRKSELRPRSHHLLLLPQHSRVVLLYYR